VLGRDVSSLTCVWLAQEPLGFRGVSKVLCVSQIEKGHISGLFFTLSFILELTSTELLCPLEGSGIRTAFKTSSTSRGRQGGREELDNTALVYERKSSWKLLSSGSIRSTDSLCKITALHQLTAALVNPGESHCVEGARQPEPRVAVLSVSYPACHPR